MIQSFRHKGLEKFFTTGSVEGIIPHHKNRLSIILATLNLAQTINDIDLPGFYLHKLSGDKDGFWSVKVNKNWGVIFRLENENIEVVDYLDYH